MSRWRPPRKAEVLRLQRIAAEHAAFLAEFEGRLLLGDGRVGPWQPATALKDGPRVEVAFVINSATRFEGAEIRLAGDHKAHQKLNNRTGHAVNGDTISAGFTLRVVQ